MLHLLAVSKHLQYVKDRLDTNREALRVEALERKAADDHEALARKAADDHAALARRAADDHEALARERDDALHAKETAERIFELKSHADYEAWRNSECA